MKENLVKQLHTNDGHLFAEYKFSNESFNHFTRHSHETFNIIAIGTGEIDIEYHEQELQYLTSNQLAVFNPQQVHLTKKNSAKLLEYHSLHIDTSWCMAIQESLFGQIDSLVPIHPNILTSHIWHHHFMTIAELILSDKVQNIESLLAALMTDLFEHYSNNITISQKNNLLYEVETYILENIDESLSLESISNITGYSSAHLNRLFKKHYGLTLHAFLLDKKLQKAKALMQNNPNATLVDIALEAGFYDQSHFIKVFKRVYALNPNIYKKA